MKKLVSILFVGALVLFAGTLLAIDLDRGSATGTPNIPADPSREEECYIFGGAEQSYSGTMRGRGNTYTFTEDEILTRFFMELSFTGVAELYFYVLESPTLDGAYTTLVEQIIATNGAGQAFYESDGINVVLQAGMFYGIGVAWQGETVGYVRDTATLPRAWELGTVEDAMQISEPPPYVSLVYNHFDGAEYSMELCFEGPVPDEANSWSSIKALYE